MFAMNVLLALGGEDRGWDTCNEAAGVLLLLLQFSNCDFDIWCIVIHKDRWN